MEGAPMDHGEETYQPPRLVAQPLEEDLVTQPNGSTPTSSTGTEALHSAIATHGGQAMDSAVREVDAAPTTSSGTRARSRKVMRFLMGQPIKLQVHKWSSNDIITKPLVHVLLKNIGTRWESVSASENGRKGTVTG